MANIFTTATVGNSPGKFADSPKVQTAASIIMTRWEASLHVGKLITYNFVVFFTGSLSFLFHQKYLVKNLVIIIYSNEFTLYLFFCKLHPRKLSWNPKVGGL